MFRSKVEVRHHLEAAGTAEAMAAAAVLPASAALSLPAAPVPAAAPGVPLPPGLTPSSMEHTLWTWAQHSLQNHLHENAIFLAERLCAEVHTDWAKHLLATCYFQSGAANRAVAVLQASTTPQNRYLLALCHVRLGKLAEAQPSEVFGCFRRGILKQLEHYAAAHAVADLDLQEDVGVFGGHRLLSS